VFRIVLQSNIFILILLVYTLHEAPNDLVQSVSIQPASHITLLTSIFLVKVPFQSVVSFTCRGCRRGYRHTQSVSVAVGLLVRFCQCFQLGALAIVFVTAAKRGCFLAMFGICLPVMKELICRFCL